MTKRTLTLLLLLTPIIATPAHAGSGYQQCNGEQCWGSDAHGREWNSQTFGDRANNSTFFSDNRGERCVQQCFNGTCFTNCD